MSEHDHYHRGYHHCMVCGDQIDLSQQVCGYICLQALQQDDVLDVLEASRSRFQFSACTSDYEEPSTTGKTIMTTTSSLSSTPTTSTSFVVVPVLIETGIDDTVRESVPNVN